jgi:ubiquitin-protein ligase
MSFESIHLGRILAERKKFMKSVYDSMILWSDGDKLDTIYCLLYDIDKYMPEHPCAKCYIDGEFIIEIRLGVNFPMAAPSIRVLTPNGKFKTGESICINGITAYHPEGWVPSTSMEVVGKGLRDFFFELTASGVAHKNVSESEATRLSTESRLYNRSKYPVIIESLYRTRQSAIDLQIAREQKKKNEQIEKKPE